MSGIITVNNLSNQSDEAALSRYLYRGMAPAAACSIAPLASTLPKVADLANSVDFVVFKAFAYIVDLFTYPIRRQNEIKRLDNLHTLFAAVDYFQATNAQIGEAKTALQKLAKQIGRSASTRDELDAAIAKIVSSKELIERAGDNSAIFQANLAALITPLAHHAFTPQDQEEVTEDATAIFNTAREKQKHLDETLPKIEARITELEAEIKTKEAEANGYGRDAAALKANKDRFPKAHYDEQFRLIIDKIRDCTKLKLKDQAELRELQTQANTIRADQAEIKDTIPKLERHAHESKQSSRYAKILNIQRRLRVRSST